MAEQAKTLEQEAQELWACYNAMSLDFLRFGASVNRAIVCPSRTFLESAQGELANIEDAFKRYREGRPQEYQEEPQKNEANTKAK